jgi:hypothetical protein
MNAIRMVAIALILGGVLALVYGGFTYTKNTQHLKVGPLELSVQEKETVNVPVWAGAGAVLFGGMLLLVGGRKG